MPTRPHPLDEIAKALRPHGLIVRGAFRPEPADRVPALPGGEPPAAVVLVGNAGPALWAAFTASPEHRDSRPDPLDRWTKTVLEQTARALGAAVLFPFSGPPYLPFQHWARRAEPVHPSPLGMLIHPDYGLWHAYRGAFAFAESIPPQEMDDRPSPCATCPDRPCLGACPVGAFADSGYDVGACRRHIAGAAGEDCIAFGCRARQACPVGREFLYDPAQAAFHMAAFIDAGSGQRP